MSGSSIAAAPSPPTIQTRLAEWVQLREVPDAGGMATPWLLTNRRDGVTLSLTPAEAAAVRSGVVAESLREELTEQGFVVGARPRTDRRRDRFWAGFGTAVSSLEIRTSQADRLARVIHRLGGRWLFSPVSLALQGVLALVGAVAVLHAFLFEPTVALKVHPGQVPLVLAMGALSVGVHELCHALVVVHRGGRVDAAGVRLHLGTPAFFVESVDAQLLDRRWRIAQAAAGAWAEWLVTGLAACWLWTGHAGLIGSVLLSRFVLLNCVNVASNLLPFVRLDGQWILADALGEPDLADQAVGSVRTLIKTKLEGQSTGRRARWLALYSLLNTMVAVALFTVSALLWWQLFGGVVEGLSHSAGGWTVLVAAVVLLGRPTLLAAAPRLRAGRATTQELTSSLAFRWQFRSRIAAVEALAATHDQLAAFDDGELGVLAGRLSIHRLAPTAHTDGLTAVFTTRRGGWSRTRRAVLAEF